LDQTKVEVVKITNELSSLYARDQISKTSEEIRELEKGGKNEKTEDLGKKLSDFIQRLPKNS
jgi:hypothetical protein